MIALFCKCLEKIKWRLYEIGIVVFCCSTVKNQNITGHYCAITSTASKNYQECEAQILRQIPKLGQKIAAVTF